MQELEQSGFEEFIIFSRSFFVLCVNLFGLPHFLVHMSGIQKPHDIVVRDEKSVLIQDFAFFDKARAARP